MILAIIPLILIIAMILGLDMITGWSVWITGPIVWAVTLPTIAAYLWRVGAASDAELQQRRT